MIPESLAKLESDPQIDLDTALKQVTLTYQNDDDSIVRTSVYRDGLGCTLAYDFTPDQIRENSVTLQDLPSATPLPVNIDSSISLDAFFEESDADYSGRYNTFGVVVAHNGEIIAEQYDEFHSKDSPMLSWSMAKTVTGLLSGTMDLQGLVTKYDTVYAGDHMMTVENLMQMSSGLQWAEASKNGVSDLGTMWYLNSDSAGYAKDKPVDYVPGTEFHYSTGTTQILSEYLGQKMGGDLQSIYDFYQTRFFALLGINNAVVEHDEVGTFRGGARVFLTPHDWIKIGQLLINKGVWNGQQLISEQWIEEMMSPGASEYYGGQLWLNDMGIWVLDLPKDTVSLRGHRGQYLVVIPSKNIVVARFGAYGSEVNKDINRANRKLMQNVADLIGVIED
ncbi:serine hydrolase domain-containing protein [Hahella ganghwensis]|uniref:serine hydrolase domain-containing protein n=1 Tax=Hahella ganghwensis TaxID=286420 RepID=UPI00037130FA|nr:serine hydrolase [Hahella ganghwensis]